MRDELCPIQELFGPEVRHCRAPFSPIHATAFNQLETLPYNDLGGPGLERLCFELLLSRGYEPRLFGRSGQPQYGIDLVAEKNGRTEVYQCKNLHKMPTAKELAEYLGKFEVEWLGDAKLPNPERFVICCPQPLRDSKSDSKWIKAKAEFRSRTGVEVGLWNLDLINGWLRHRPDIVADLFSDRHAEAFCEVDDWKPDLFTPVREGASGDLRLKRYFERRRIGRLYVDQGYEQKITEALDRSSVILVRGLPGTGKTLTSLALAERFRDGHWRPYFLDVGDDEFTKMQMREGIRRRLSRPSIFVLENCHEKLGEVEKALRDLAPEMVSGRAKVICLTRWVPGSNESRSDDSELFSELEAQGAMVGFENDDKLLKHIVTFWKPEFGGLSAKRFARLCAVCGRNLLLLDEVTNLVGSPADIDTLSPSEMYGRLRYGYFDYRTADDLIGTRKLAALAQFDIRPRADVLALDNDERVVIDSLCVRAGHPPRWHFLHSSAAELVLHALWSGMGVIDPEEVAKEAATDIVDYFDRVQAASLRPLATLEALETEVLGVVRNRLMLTDENGEGRIKAAVLDSEPVLALLPKLLTSPTSARTISLCALVAHRTGAARAESYGRLLRVVLENALDLDSSDPQWQPRVLPLLGIHLRTLKLVAPAEYVTLTTRLNAERLFALIEANGTIRDFFKIVGYASPDLVRELIEILVEARVAKLVRKTIEAGHSIGTVALSLWQLRRSSETVSLGRELERKIGPERFLELIEANGTIFELFKIILNGSPYLASGLIEALDKTQVAKLIRKAIESGRSIGTLDFTLRELQSTQEMAALGRELERKIGPEHFLDLIESNGTIFELFNIIRYASPDLARGLIEALDEARVANLIQQTIHAGRSIGTLNFALRDLHRRHETVSLGRDLERKIGPERFLNLIKANGTIFELFRIIQHASSDLARELIEALDETVVAQLIRKTIDSKRSIGTLNFTLRELYGRKETVSLGRDLERKIGPERFLDLIEANGTIFELFMIIRNASPSLARALIEALNAARVAKLIQKTVDAERSIGTLNFTLRKLHGRKETVSLGCDLERRIGAEGFWILIVGTGSAGPIVDLLRDVSPDFRNQLLAAARDLSEEQWERVIGRGDVSKLCRLIFASPEVFGETVGGEKLLRAVKRQVPSLVVSGGWYQRRSAAQILAMCADSPASNAVWQVLIEWLLHVPVEQLAFPTLREAVYGLSLLYEQRPDARSHLATRLRDLLPSQQHWTLDPGKDMDLPVLLLHIAGKLEISAADAEYVIGGLMQRLTLRFLARCGTEDMLWTLWALFGFAYTRNKLAPAAFGRSLPSEVQQSLNGRLATNLSRKGQRDELRARFALIGLLSLLELPVDSSVLATLGRELKVCAKAGAWWLIADQSFVMAWLVLRGIEMAEPFPDRVTTGFLQRLLTAADEYTEIDVAAEYLREDVRRRLRQLSGTRWLGSYVNRPPS